MKFEVEFSWEVEEGIDLFLVVKGIRQPYRPESRRGHPDDWTPAEGGELEDLEIAFKNRHGVYPLPKFMRDQLLDDESFLEKVSGKVDE